MKVTRRQMLMYSALGLGVAARPAIALAADNTFDWKTVCRRWMRVLLPDDEKGPGADCPAVWERIERLMASDPEVKSWWFQGLAALAQQGVPQTPADLDKLLDRRTPLGRFLAYFQHFLLDSYYGAAVGWAEFGLTAPPQPRGFHIKG